MAKAQLEPDNCDPLIDAVERGEVTLAARSRGSYPGARIPKNALPGLRTIGYWDAVGPQSWGLPMHRNEGIEICYLLSGESSFATDFGEWNLRAGDITITRPWQRHRLGDPNIRPSKLFWMILDVEAHDERSTWDFADWIGPDVRSRRELLRVFRKNQCPHLSDRGHQLRPFMEQTCERMADDGPMVVAQLACSINALLLAIVERLSEGIDETSQDSSGFDQTIRQFFQGLESSIDKAAEPWSVAEMAKACRVGKSYLTTSCRHIFNATPAELLGRTRLNHARTLLSQRAETSITDIAMAVGFGSSQYFANCFRKQFGMTPQQFRDRTKVE
ncbi:MAG: AraC family transcriptional regulator [Verrucomicrobiota bacterium]